MTLRFMKSSKSIIILAAIASATVLWCHAKASPQDSTVLHFHSGPMSKEEFDRSPIGKKTSEFNRLMKVALEDANREDFKGQEATLLQAEGLGLEFPDPLFELAKIYSAQGKDQLTYQQLHRLLFPRLGVGSSTQNDSVVITYYADLCQRLGKTDEAREAYVRACHNGIGWNQEPYKSLACSIDPTQSLIHLRATALAACATPQEIYDAHMRSNYVKESVALYPESPLTHLAYADEEWSRGNSSNVKIAFLESWEAEHLAPLEAKPLINAFRKQRNLVNTGSVLVIDDGKAYSHSVPFVPPFLYVSPKPIHGFKTILDGQRFLDKSQVKSS